MYRNIYGMYINIVGLELRNSSLIANIVLDLESSFGKFMLEGFGPDV